MSVSDPDRAHRQIINYLSTSNAVPEGREQLPLIDEEISALVRDAAARGGSVRKLVDSLAAYAEGPVVEAAPWTIEDAHLLIGSVNVAARARALQVQLRVLQPLRAASSLFAGFRRPFRPALLVAAAVLIAVMMFVRPWTMTPPAGNTGASKARHQPGFLFFHDKAHVVLWSRVGASPPQDNNGPTASVNLQGSPEEALRDAIFPALRSLPSETIPHVEVLCSILAGADGLVEHMTEEQRDEVASWLLPLEHGVARQGDTQRASCALKFVERLALRHPELLPKAPLRSELERSLEDRLNRLRDRNFANSERDPLLSVSQDVELERALDALQRSSADPSTREELELERSFVEVRVAQLEDGLLAALDEEEK